MKNHNRLLIVALLLTGGCGSLATTQPTAADAQNNALNDPMGYKPSLRHDISGGDITTFDRAGFKQDMNDALNP